MNTKSKIVLAAVAGAALGATAIQGLHAQAKLKAYSIGEIEVTDASAQPGYVPPVRNAIEQAHGRSLRTLNGKSLDRLGTPARQIAKDDTAVRRRSRKVGRSYWHDRTLSPPAGLSTALCQAPAH